MARFNTALTSSIISGTATIGTPYSGAFTEFTGTAPYTVTLPSPVLFPGVNQTFYNGTSGQVTLSVSGALFVGTGASGAATFVLNSGNVVSLFSNGTNYVVISEDGSPLTATTGSFSGNVTINGGSATLSATPQTVTLNPTGASTIDNINIGVTTRGSGAFNTLTANQAVTFTANTASSGTGTGTVVVTGGLGVSGTVYAGAFNGNLTGTVQTAAQPNITSVGNLSTTGLTVDTTTLVVDAANDRVGIGTANPTTRLQVNNAADSRIIIFETGTTPYTATLELASQAIGTYGALLQYTSSAETLTLKAYGRTATGTTQGSILFNTKVANTTDTTVMTIHGFRGNVGIGTTSPNYKLEVVSAAGDNSPFTVRRNDWQAGEVRLNLALQYAVSGYISSGITEYVTDTGYIALNYKSGTSTYAEGLRVSNIGNVGIGTNNPNTKLEVAGALTVNGRQYFNGSASFYSLGSFNTGSAQWVLLGRFTGGTTGETLNLQFYGANGYNGSFGQHSRTFIQIRNGNGNPIDTNVSVDYHTEGQSSMVLDVRVQNVNGIAYGAVWDVYVQINGVCGNAYYIPFINSAATWSHTGTAGVGAPTVGSTVISGTNLFMMKSVSYFGSNVGIGVTNPTALLDISTSGTADTIGIRRSTNNNNGMLKFTTAGTDDWILGERNDATSNFRLYSYGTSSDVLTVLRSSGNVGIGTTSPQVTFETGYTRVYNSGAAPSIGTGGPGKGLELHYVTSGRTQGEGGYAISYDRANSAYKAFTIDASAINLSQSGATKVTIALGMLNVEPNLNIFSSNAGAASAAGYCELFRVAASSLCTSGIFSLGATRGGYVAGGLFTWSTTHNGSGRGVITQLSSGEYSNFSLSADVASGGDVIICADWGSSQSYSISVIKFVGGYIDYANAGTLWSSPNGGYPARYTRSTIALGFKTQNGAFDGSLSKGSGSFRIEHPLPALKETHNLVHSFIEGPKADLIYRGKVALVVGRADVNIDTAATMTEGTFELLCRDVQCFTTNETDWSPVRGSVTGNILTIECQSLTSTATISWMVIGERKDKHMYDTEWTDSSGRPIVEPLKNPVQTDFPPYPENVNTNTTEEDHGTI